ncbi:MAG: AAC(3) family N-acetyltransferase [Bradyrhizobium sp.]|nr:AAC(3) family N-acetyltransferase [Bradyrhizobium sp.]
MKRMVKRAIPYLPKSLQSFLRNVAELRRQHTKAQRKARSTVAVAEIVQKLDFLLPNGTQDVILHSSISNIGKLDVPATALADTLYRKIVGKGRTLVVPALPFSTTMEEYLRSQRKFDVASAPNAMGALPNIFMAMHGARRSLHPTHSVVALGPRADFYVAGHHLDPTPFGPHSPFRKLTEQNGSIIMLGVGLNSVTSFHVYEDLLGELLPFEVYLKEKFQIAVVDENGATTTVEAVCHDARLSGRRECERARAELNDAGAIATLPLGESEISVIDARMFTYVLLDMLTKGKSIYGPVNLTSLQRKVILESAAEFR